MNRLNLIKNKIFIIFFVLVCLGYSQSKKQAGFWTEHKQIWASGFNYENHKIPFWHTAIITLALSIKDEDIYRQTKTFQNQHTSVDKPSETITLLGDGYVDLSLLGLFYLKGILWKDKRAEKTALLGFKGMLHTGIVVQVLKHISGRQRPSAENGKDRWHGPSGAFKRYTPGRWAFYDAFPSGHTIAAWSLATVVSHQYRHLKIVPPLVYVLAAGAGVSRITEDAHWASDVFLGAIIGFEVTRQIIQFESTSNVTLVPQQNGIQLVYFFK
jgi:hypothetical protein